MRAAAAPVVLCSFQFTLFVFILLLHLLEHHQVLRGRRGRPSLAIGCFDFIWVIALPASWPFNCSLLRHRVRQIDQGEGPHSLLFQSANLFFVLPGSSNRKARLDLGLETPHKLPIYCIKMSKSSKYRNLNLLRNAQWVLLSCIILILPIIQVRITGQQ